LYATPKVPAGVGASFSVRVMPPPPISVQITAAFALGTGIAIRAKPRRIEVITRRNFISSPGKSVPEGYTKAFKKKTKGWYFPLMSLKKVLATANIAALLSTIFLIVGDQRAYGEETAVDFANFKISLKASKVLTAKSGQITTTATINEAGRFCTFLYVLDIDKNELAKLRDRSVENFEYLLGSGSEFKDVVTRGQAVIKPLCDKQKKSQIFKGKSAIPKELGWKKPLKSGTYIYVAVLGFSNDPNLSKFAVPSRVVAVSDFLAVKVQP
jgi:hypothetical protein